jgi:hypothetical protein
MNPIGTAAALATLLLMPVTGFAQAEKPEAAKAESATKLAAGAPPRSRTDVDARSCLEFATDIEIHQCAEKYRWKQPR